MIDSSQDAFRIETEASDERCTIRAIGELDIAASEPVTEAVRRAGDSGAAVIVLDLGGVTFIDSAGVRCVLQAVAASRADSDKLRIGRDYSEPVRRLFELVGAADRLPYA